MQQPVIVRGRTHPSGLVFAGAAPRVRWVRRREGIVVVEEEAEEAPDRIVVDLWVRWDRPGPPAGFVPAGAKVWERKGHVSWNLAVWDFAPPRWEDRQLALDAALAEALAHVRALDGVPGNVPRLEQLWVELRPSAGTAGVVLKPELLRPLIELDVVVMLNSL